MGNGGGKDVGTGRREIGGHREEGKRWVPEGGKEVDTGRREKGGKRQEGMR